MNKLITFFSAACLVLGLSSFSILAEDQAYLKGEFAKKFDTIDAGKSVDLSQIVNANGELFDLDTLKDRVVLVNFWATWCVPCRHEMPTLNQAAEQWGEDGLTVLTVSVDRTSAQAQAYLKRNGFESLTFGYDAKMDVFASLEGFGLPFTLLVDRDGQEIGHLSGPADWSSDDAGALIEHFL